jgi:hypothetical protein
MRGQRDLAHRFDCLLRLDSLPPHAGDRKFEIIKDSVAHITTDQRLQALLVAFGSLIEGAAGFGTSVA